MKLRYRQSAGVALVVLALAVAGCGGGSKAAPSHVGASAANRAEFSWLRPEAPPAAWRIAPIPSGAAMPYPQGWERVRGDAGTATAMVGGAGDKTLGYLNLTPLQGAETLSNWARFRVAHNAEEGDRQIKTLAVGTGLRFRTGHGTCVRDSYSSSTSVRYVEIACLVVGSKATSVIVGASPPSDWRQTSPLLERAMSGLTT